METLKLKKFAQFARRSLIEQISAKLKLVIDKDSAARRERPTVVSDLESEIHKDGDAQVVEKAAYTWFNRFCALRFMDVNRYTRINIVSPADPGQFQPEILAEAKMGHIDEEMVDESMRKQIRVLLDGSSPSSDPQTEAYRLLIVAACNDFHRAMPYLFEKIADYTELLMPDDLLSGNSILAYTREAMTPDICQDVEVIGWLYQFYISEKKEEVFDGLRKNKKITPENIPAATQLFTPHWIVRYLVENSLGRLWLLNRPSSKLAEKMEYYIPPDTSVVSGQWSVNSKEGEKHDKELQGADHLAEGDGFSGRSVSSEQGVSEGGNLCPDQSDSSGSSLNSVQHSGGTSAAIQGGVSQLSFDCTGFLGGSGNPTTAGHTSKLSVGVRNSESNATARGNKQDAHSVAKQTGHRPESVNSTSVHCSLETDYLRISSPEEIRICDPACGSGHMLTYAFDLLYAIYEEEGYEPAEIPEKILTHNLYGIEIDERAGELAAFALTMKARAKQRRFFRKPVQPNICVLRNIKFEDEELKNYMDFVGRNLFTLQLQTTLSQFEEVDNFGSLIRPELIDLSEIINTLNSKDISGQLFLNQIHQKVLLALKQTDYLSPKYHVVIANPPYMGGKGMNPRLSAWVKDNYADVKSDLFSAFIVRNTELALPKGQIGFMTPFVWMFISSYEKLRDFLINQKTITSLVQLEYSGFDGATVPICTFTVENAHRPDFNGGYVRLSDFRGSENQGPRTIEAVRNPDCGWFYRASASEFKKIPGCPIAYWVSPQVGNTFQNSRPIEHYFPVNPGIRTGKDEWFLKLWFEVSQNHTQFKLRDPKQMALTKWFPLHKGGNFRKWYGNAEHVIDLGNDGKNIKTKSPDFRLRDDKWYFKPFVSWSRISSADIAFRYFPEGVLFSDAGPGIFAEKSCLEVMSLLNSKLGNLFLKIINPTLNYQKQDIEAVPYIRLGSSSDVAKAVEYEKNDWDAYETSWDFQENPLVREAKKTAIQADAGCGLLSDSGEDGQWIKLSLTLSKVYIMLRRVWQKQTEEMRRLEIENNRIFIEAYGLQDELTPEVPWNEITLTCNPWYRYGKRAEDAADVSNDFVISKSNDRIEISPVNNNPADNCPADAFPFSQDTENRLLEDTIKEFISYAVGCMFGRYSLDMPGLVLANQGETLVDFVRKVASDQCPVAGKGREDYAGEKLQEVDSLTEGYGPDRSCLPDNETVSQKRTVRTDKSIEAGESQQNDSGTDGKTVHCPLATSHLSFVPDEDNVIPILNGDWFTDDISERFRNFLRVTFGEEHYEENLKFIEKALGKNGKARSIRDYFIKDFYTDHVKRYKKRPIYWMFSSPKGSFNALIYMHRYRSDTVSVVLGYLRDFRTKLTAHKNHLEAVSISGSASQTEKTKALKEIENLRKMITEIEDYERDVLYPLAAKQLAINLDDGVKVNYLKFEDALKKIVGLDAKEEE